MTKKQSIDYLKDLWNEVYNEDSDGYNYAEAIDMAIEALENEPIPCEKCIHVKSCRKVIILKNRTYKLIKYCSEGMEKKDYREFNF